MGKSQRTSTIHEGQGKAKSSVVGGPLMLTGMREQPALRHCSWKRLKERYSQAGPRWGSGTQQIDMGRAASLLLLKLTPLRGEDPKPRRTKETELNWKTVFCFLMYKWISNFFFFSCCMEMEAHEQVRFTYRRIKKVTSEVWLFSYFSLSLNLSSYSRSALYSQLCP